MNESDNILCLSEWCRLWLGLLSTMTLPRQTGCGYYVPETGRKSVCVFLLFMPETVWEGNRISSCVRGKLIVVLPAPRHMHTYTHVHTYTHTNRNTHTHTNMQNHSIVHHQFAVLLKGTSTSCFKNQGRPEYTFTYYEHLSSTTMLP